MAIRITSKRDKFCRCGVRHPAKPTIYADDRFSKKELKVLEEEPMLLVETGVKDPAKQNNGKKG